MKQLKPIVQFSESMNASPAVSAISVNSYDTQHNFLRGPTLHHEKLPQLPRGWQRIGHETTLVLKSLGLGIITTTFRRFKRNFSEPKKIAIQQSRATASFRCLIHVLPVAVALMEIIFNWQGYYIGASLTGQSYLQFAAKAHEILIQASLTSILMSYIRYEITTTKGLPFGAFLSGLQFAQFSYLWSTELWTSILSREFNLRRKLAFLALVLSCAIIAATAGPSSANLLIPRSVLWPVQPTYFTINSTSQDLWPDQVNASNIPKDCAFLSGSAVNTVCPAADAIKILRNLNAFNSTDSTSSGDNGISNTYGVDLWDLGTSISSRFAVTSVCLEGSIQNQVCASCPHAIIADAAYQNQAMWAQRFQKSSHPSSDEVLYVVQDNYFEPYAAASCLEDTIRSVNDQNSIRFALISEAQSALETRKVVTVPSLIKADYYGVPGNVSEYRLSWVNLPADVFGNNRIGAIILHPRPPSLQAVQNLTTCTLGAGWGTSSLQSALTSPNDFLSSITRVPNSVPTGGSILNQIPFGYPVYSNFSGYAYPQQRISISTEWLNYLNPFIATADGSNTTLINAYLSVALPVEYSETATAKILSLMLTAGLSKVGYALSAEGLPDSGPCEGCLALESRYYLEGVGYSSDGTILKLAIVVMFIYCLLAFAHSVYLITTGLSSNTWDTAAEVIALAMNSSPTQFLQNTCAGILGIRTFQTKVRVMATDNGNGNEHLEIVFGDVPSHKLWLVVENQQYGALREKKAE